CGRERGANPLSTRSGALFEAVAYRRLLALKEQSIHDQVFCMPTEQQKTLSAAPQVSNIPAYQKIFLTDQ
ncbi:MAG: hypothetical protein ACIRZW_10355, partial [Limosilactobacillus mucosae]